jgi:pyruvyltransferase
MQIKCHYHHKRNNFGDMLTPFIIKHYTGQKVELAERNDTGKILACGSILGRALKEDDFVWGTGCMKDKVLHAPRGVKIYAVRGPLTRRLIKGAVAPQVYGDPGLLLPEIYNPKISKINKIGLLPHFKDYRRIKRKFPDNFIIDIKSPIKVIVDEMKSCELIITSSLHGVIVSEAYGIPVVWAKIMNRREYRRKTGSGFKFHDHFLSTGRRKEKPTSWNKAVSKPEKFTLPKPKINTKPLKEAFKEMMEDYMAFDR